jgi:hypothetical protein
MLPGVTPEELRRRYQPNPARELVSDLRDALAATDDPATRQELYDVANEVAPGLVDSGDQLTALTAELHREAFGPPADTLGDGWRRQAVEDHPELADVFAAIDGAESDAEKAEVVLAAVSSGAVDGDPVALKALLAADPTVGADDSEARWEQELADDDRQLAEAAAQVHGGESRAQAMLREHLEAAEAAESGAEVPASA